MEASAWTSGNAAYGEDANLICGYRVDTPWRLQASFGARARIKAWVIDESEGFDFQAGVETKPITLTEGTLGTWEGSCAGIDASNPPDRLSPPETDQTRVKREAQFGWCQPGRVRNITRCAPDSAHATQSVRQVCGDNSEWQDDRISRIKCAGGAVCMGTGRTTAACSEIEI